MKASNDRAKPVSFILLAVIMGVSYLLYKIIENIPLKITLIIIVNIIICFIYLAIMVSSTNCPFHNDERLFDNTGANSEIWYRYADFCSVADPINVSFEVVNGEKRCVSATNQFLSYCMNRGEGCPIFKKYSMMSKDKLRAFYKSKWEQEMLRIGSNAEE